MVFEPVAVTDPAVAVMTPFRFTAALPANWEPFMMILPVLALKVAAEFCAQIPLPVFVMPNTSILPVVAVMANVE